MKRIKYLLVFVSLITWLLSGISVYAGGVIKWINVGKIRIKVLDNCHQSETEGLKYIGAYDFCGHQDIEKMFDWPGFRNSGLRIGVKNWKDEHGTLYPVRLAGAPYGTSDSQIIMFTVPDDKGITIRKYMRYQPPSIIVDGMNVNDPFPFDEADEVNPGKIPGNADCMVESVARTWIGLELHQRVLGWSQKNHDDYIIYDWVFKNTGNVDPDPEIELPNQTLDSLYIMREFTPQLKQSKEWAGWYGCRPEDTLRIKYVYSSRTKGAAFDDFGAPSNTKNSPRLYATQYYGEQTLFMSNTPNDMTNDDITQPRMHTIWDFRNLKFKEHSLMHSPAEWAEVYEVMKYGFMPLYGIPSMMGTYPGTYHEASPEDRGIVKFVIDYPNWGGGYHEVLYSSYGPYTLAPGDSIRLVFAFVVGTISKQKAFEIGGAWYNKSCTWLGPDNLPPQYTVFPSLYDNSNDKAKDCWVATGRDSLFMNATACKWNMDNKYDIPIAPPPPSLEVQSRANAIRLTWGEESETASDFAGYRVYRATASYKDSAFYAIFECGKGTANLTVVHSYDDATAVRGASYYYYVTAFDDGVSNKPDFHGKRESLESGKYANMTTRSATLAREAGKSLDDIRVVPNPFSLKATDVQFPGKADENKIMFYNIPEECTIRIFSESGDLVKIIEHTTGSGDAGWGVLAQEQQTTDTGQRPVSGLYIANITTPDGKSKNVKFLIVR